MSNIDKQALNQEKIEWLNKLADMEYCKSNPGHWLMSLKDTNMLAKLALRSVALLDELERNQQYIKSRDQENEDIALTVGKLRVELEAEKQRAKDLFMENVRLKSGIAGLIHLGIRYADVDVMKIAGDAQLSTPCTDDIINSIIQKETSDKRAQAQNVPS